MDIVNWSLATLMSIFIILATFVSRQAFFRYAKPNKWDTIFVLVAAILIACMYAVAYGLNQAFAPVPLCIPQ